MWQIRLYFKKGRFAIMFKKQLAQNFYNVGVVIDLTLFPFLVSPSSTLPYQPAPKSYWSYVAGMRQLFFQNRLLSPFFLFRCRRLYNFLVPLRGNIQGTYAVKMTLPKPTSMSSFTIYAFSNPSICCLPFLRHQLNTKNPSMRDVLSGKRPSLREIFVGFVPLRGK